MMHRGEVDARARTRTRTRTRTHLTALDAKVIVDVKNDHDFGPWVLPQTPEPHGAHHPRCTLFLGEAVAADVAAMAYTSRTFQPPPPTPNPIPHALTRSR